MQDSIFLDRDKYIGGSDVPIILGMSPYTSRDQLLRTKARLEEEDITDNPYTLFGEAMEGKIRDYINTQPEFVKDPFVEGKHIEEGDPIGFRCHTDGENSDTILEVKTTSNIERNLEIYRVQLCFYMMRTGMKKGMLACYIRPADLDQTFDKERLTTIDFTLDGFTESGLVEKIDNGIRLFIGDLKELKVKGN